MLQVFPRMQSTRVWKYACVCECLAEGCRGGLQQSLPFQILVCFLVHYVALRIFIFFFFCSFECFASLL